MLELSPQTIGFFKVVSPNDPAFDKENKAHKWDEYKKDGDLAHLVLKEGQAATIFLCDFNLPAQVTRKIKDAMMGRKDQDGKPAVAYGEWSHTCVEYALKSIENCKLELKRDGTGKLMPNVMTQLERWGMIDEIFSHYIRVTNEPEKAAAKNS